MKCFAGIDHIFFDFDGTLCDTAGDIMDSWRAAFAELKLDVPHFEQVYHVGPPTETAARVIFPDADDEFIRRVCRVYRQSYYNSTYPKSLAYPGVDAMLAKLKQEGKTLFVATNKNGEPLGRLIDKLGWGEFFTEQLNRDMLPPGPIRKSLLLRRTLEKYRLDPRRSAMVGDAAADIAAGKEANVVTVAVTYGYGTPEELAASGADWMLSLEEVRDYL